MARTVSLTRYPLLKATVPLSVIVLVVGVTLFLTQAGEEKDPMVLLPFLAAFALLLGAGFLWRRKEELTLVLPSDRLHDASRRDLEGILETLDLQRERGELSPERYTKARNRVLKEMKQGK